MANTNTAAANTTDKKLRVGDEVFLKNVSWTVDEFGWAPRSGFTVSLILTADVHKHRVNEAWTGICYTRQQLRGLYRTGELTQGRQVERNR